MDAIETENSTDEAKYSKIIPLGLSTNAPPTPPRGTRSPLRHLPLTIRKLIFEYVLDLNQRTYLFLSDLETPPPIALVCKQFALEYRNLVSGLPLHVSPVLGSNASPGIVKCGKGVRFVYGDSIEDLNVSVRLIQQVEYRRSSEDLFEAIMRMPGVNTASALLVPSIEVNTVTSLRILTPASLARDVGRICRLPHPHSKQISTFAITNHANIVGWLRFTNTSVEHLTIRVLGIGLWDGYLFSAEHHLHRALPLISLLAAVIMHRPLFVKRIKIAGCGVFTTIAREMWEKIPMRTPITGVSPLLDLLVGFPFGEERGKLGLGGQGREGNMWGLKTSLQWQAIIMRARHGKGQPEWRFLQRGWGKFVAV